MGGAGEGVGPDASDKTRVGCKHKLKKLTQHMACTIKM